MLTLFSRTRRRTSVLRPQYARLAVERLEGREAPSSLDVTSLVSPPADSTTATGSTVISLVAAPTPPSDTSTAPAAPVVVVPAPASPAAPVAPMAGDTLPPLADEPVAPGLAAPTITGYTEDGDWNYTVNGTVTDPNPASLTVNITVDGVAEPAAPVTPVLNPDGTPTGTGTFSTTFGLPACTSATNGTRYGTAVATDGTRVSPVTIFTIDQTPRGGGIIP